MGYLQVFLQPGTTVVGWADRLSIAIVRYRFRTPGPRGKKKVHGTHTERDRQREGGRERDRYQETEFPVQASCAATGWGAPHMPTQTRRCTALTAKCDFGGGGGVAGVEGGCPLGAECAERVSEHVLGGTHPTQTRDIRVNRDSRSLCQMPCPEPQQNVGLLLLLLLMWLSGIGQAPIDKVNYPKPSPASAIQTPKRICVELLPRKVLRAGRGPSANGGVC